AGRVEERAQAQAHVDGDERQRVVLDHVDDDAVAEHVAILLGARHLEAQWRIGEVARVRGHVAHRALHGRRRRGGGGGGDGRRGRGWRRRRGVGRPGDARGRACGDEHQRGDRARDARATHGFFPFSAWSSARRFCAASSSTWSAPFISGGAWPAAAVSWSMPCASFATSPSCAMRASCCLTIGCTSAGSFATSGGRSAAGAPALRWYTATARFFGWKYCCATRCTSAAV